MVEEISYANLHLYFHVMITKEKYTINYTVYEIFSYTTL